VTLLANPTLRLFIGAALISLSPVWVRLVEVAPSTSGFYRVLFGGAALVVYLLLTRRRLQLSQRAWWLLTVASAFLSVNLWFWHRSIILIGPGLSTLIANFQVFIMMIAGIVFLRQTPRPIQIIAMPLALLGIALIVGFDWNALPKDYKLGVIFGFLTAVTYASFMLTLRAVRVTSAFRVPTRELAVVSVICSVMMAFAVLAEGESLTIPSYADLGWLSLSEVTTVEAGIALLLQPTLSFVWDVLFFDRPTSAIEFVGAGIALLAIYLGSRPASKQV